MDYYLEYIAAISIILFLKMQNVCLELNDAVALKYIYNLLYSGQIQFVSVIHSV